MGNRLSSRWTDDVVLFSGCGVRGVVFRLNVSRHGMAGRGGRQEWHVENFVTVLRVSALVSLSGIVAFLVNVQLPDFVLLEHGNIGLLGGGDAGLDNFGSVFMNLN